MDKYITAIDAAKKWGIKKRRVLNYCSEGRINGACKFGNIWQIPSSAEKPSDPRKHKIKKEEVFFTLPKQCPNLIMTNFFNKPGQAFILAENLDSDIEAKNLYLAELDYFKGEIEKAKQSTKMLISTTFRKDIKIGSAFILSLCAMYEGDTLIWIYARDTILKIPCNNKTDEAIRDFYIGNIDSALYSKNFPKWFTDGDFSPIPIDCFPLARFIYLKWLLMDLGNPEISKICGPIISQSHAEGAVISEIYCLILTAIGFHDRGENNKATELIDRAINIALPDKIYSPFAEYRNQLGILLDERLTILNQVAKKDILSLYKRLINGWTILCKKVYGIEYVKGLTQREYHAAKLAAKGLSNAEIAKRMNLSINTVKKYISEVIGKTGAIDRKELKELIILGGDTLP